MLFKTGSHPDKETFRTDFNSLSPELVHALKAVEPGLYVLVALPLRVEDGDGSPVRAVLLRD